MVWLWRGDPEFTLEPFDEIYVRRSPGYREQQNVTVNGEVLCPGVYTQSVHPMIVFLILSKRAGGVTSKAYVNGARLLRRMNADELARVSSALQLAKHSSRDSLVIDSMSLEKVYYVGIDLKKALENPGGEADLVPGRR